MIKKSTWQIKGMQRDLSVSKFSSEYAYENKNIRIMSTDDNTLLSIVNEKGTKEVSNIEGIDSIKGLPIGQAVLGNYLVLFTTDQDNKKDYIYRITVEGESFHGKVLYDSSNGNLNFSPYHPIETLCYYENVDVQKVYWIDGINQTRLINIVSETQNYNSTSFDFVSSLNLEEEVTIQKSTQGGTFASGVIQYVFTYYKKYGQESNIFYMSPLYYVSYYDKGGSPEDKISNSFNISIKNLDRNFDYVRIYSILKTLIDGTAEAKRVVDLPILNQRMEYSISSYDVSLPSSAMTMVLREGNIKDKTLDQYEPSGGSGDTKYWEFNTDIYSGIDFGGDYLYWDAGTTFTIVVIDDKEANMSLVKGNMTGMLDISSINYVDTGTSGDSIDASDLLYVGGKSIVPSSMAQKDNTLFLGNIKEEVRVIDDSIKEHFRGQYIAFTLGKSITPPEPEGYYAYKSQLGGSSYTFKTFKYLETYRLGIQFQHHTGVWSDPIWINDVRNTAHIDTDLFTGDKIDLPVAQIDIYDSDIISKLISEGYVNVRPVIVYPTLNDRECICQGILCPTVYNVGDRNGNSPFVQSSWFVRPNAPFDIFKSTHFRAESPQFKFSTAPPNLGNTFTVQNADAKYKVNDLAVGEDGLWVVLCTRIEGDGIPAASNGYIEYTPSTGGILERVMYLEYISDPSVPSIWGGDYSSLISPESNSVSKYSRGGIMANDTTIVKNDNTGSTTELDIVNMGAWAEFRHNAPIPSNNNRNAEIQCIVNPPEPYQSGVTELGGSNWVAGNSNNYYVDQSIVTLHSPDIEFDSNLDNYDFSGAKLRIVGVVPLTAFDSNIDINVSTPVNNYKDRSELPVGFYKENIAVENDFTYISAVKHLGDSHFGYRSLISGAFWFDELTERKQSNPNLITTGFAVYPWHRNGSLNNTKWAVDGYKSAMLDKKRMINYKYSYKTAYYDNDNIWVANYGGDNGTGIAGVKVFNSNEVTALTLPAPENSGLGALIYYGNVDKVLSMNAGLTHSEYPIIISGFSNTGDVNTAHKLFKGKYIEIPSSDSDTNTGVDPVVIRYKSSPHAVVVLNYTKENKQKILPTISDGNNISDTWYVNGRNSTIGQFFWDSDCLGVVQDTIPIMKGPAYPLSLQHGWLWLGELYRDDIANRFGGQSEDAILSNLWLPCGEPVSIRDSKGSIIVRWSEGDTYYQRYDHLKTYPFSLKDQNQVTEVVSFMCETKVNIDGKYDPFRGNLNMAATSESFNKVNEAYSQTNNNFTYRVTDTNTVSGQYYPNLITYTKTKTSGEITDTWTNITLASTLELDGDKGPINSINRMGNNLYSFQDTGISQILYNENMQISSTDGVPIEIANSGKVNGKRYISDKLGCQNKWSICETSNGIYFVDDITKGIFLLNNQLDNISDRLGFHSWINSRSTGINVWNPKDFSGFVTYYDKVNGDVFFISKDECLAFSEPLGQFSSFYSYENVPYFSNILDRGLWVKDGKLWLHNEGDYNTFFNSYQPFYTTVISNPDMTQDKIFNTLEFRADSWNSEGKLLDTTYDTLSVWNEYQSGESKLTHVLGRPSSLKKKFRIWRANIPRDKSNNKDRMRNPWLYLKLSMESENTNKTILHDMVVHYFE